MSVLRKGSWPPLFSIDAVALELRRLPSLLLVVYLSRQALRVQSGLQRHTLDEVALWILVALWIWVGVAYILDRYAWDTARKINWEDEVVLVTGGSSGLGRIIVDTYAMRGVSVAVLDVSPYEGSYDSVKWYHTDVGDEDAVLKAKAAIEAEFGTVTILINNAGIINGQTIIGLNSSSVSANFRINLLSHFHTIRALLPSMMARPEGGTIVTVASVLGELGGVQLSDYAASKAGLIAMHKSLQAEVEAAGKSAISTILVKPGQLSTALFAGVETPNSFLGPVVDPLDLAREIIRVVDSGRSGVIAMPFYAEYIEWLAILPYGMQKFVRHISGLDRAMKTFRGREKR